jgi:hypothetical protein
VNNLNQEFNRYEVLQRVLTYLNKSMVLPTRHNGLDIVYRIHVADETTVKIDGFLPTKTDGQNSTKVSPAADFREGGMWVATQAAAFEDFSMKHDGLGTSLVRLNTPFRDQRYHEFFINEDKPVFGLLLLNEIAQTILDETQSEDSAE